MLTRGFRPPVQLPLPVSELGKWKNSAKPGRRHPRTPPRAIPQLRMISIIIPAHNEQMYLPATLRELRRQNYPSFEVFVVANGCTDETPKLPERNLGALMAKGELLVFL